MFEVLVQWGPLAVPVAINATVTKPSKIKEPVWFRSVPLGAFFL
jgi:hypothetical protein